MTANICEQSFTLNDCYGNFYAGGDVVWSTDGSRFYCLNKTEICEVELATGQVVQKYSVNPEVSTYTSNTRNDNGDDTDQDTIYCFALNENKEYLVTAHRGGLLRLWSLDTKDVVKLWKSQHKGPVVKLQFSPCGNYICSSGDSTLRVWDYANNRCISVLKDFEGPSLLIRFHPHPSRAEVFAADASNVVYCWNYVTKKLERQLRGHLSQVTAMSFKDDTENCEFLVTASRDKVLIVWNLKNGETYKVIPMYEELEGVFFYNPAEEEQDELCAIVACAKGSIRMVDCRKAKLSVVSDCADYEIQSLFYCKTKNQIAIVTKEHNILTYTITTEKKLSGLKQLIGFNDEILDLTFFGTKDRYLAVATNSNNIKVYDTSDDMNCKIISGHTDIVMALSSNGSDNLLLSTGKDFSIFLWTVDEATFTVSCLARNMNSHTSSIGSISFGYNTTSVLASACQGGTLKLWNLKRNKANEYSFILKSSAIAHDKEVNSVTFSPNNKMLATASLDKNVKLWSTETLAILGTLRGHTRSVYCVRFSPVDQIALTASSDCSLRLWSIATMSCIKRFEQDCTILRAEFIDHGKFILSAATDGLIKVWNIKTNACLQTLDGHADRVWALAISSRSKKHFFSGAADSKLIKWRDNTDEIRNEDIEKRQSMLQEEQALQSLLQEKRNLQKAFHLALTLTKPKTTYKVISHYVRKRDMQTIETLISELSPDQTNTLLDHIKIWSTNSRYCRVANIILHYLLSELIANPNRKSHNTAHLVEVLTPYVQRHFKRLTELKQDLAFLEFIVASI